MPKKVIPHNQEDNTVEGFMWDGFRLTEFARWYKGNFCYHADTDTLVIDSTQVHLGDWVIREDNNFIILDNDEFESDFDIAED